jgi:Putative DNA-binding domain
MWEHKRLRDVTEADVRQVVNSGLEEHLQLEYKSAFYADNDQGNRESLQDICMFANAGGGILLIGISEQRENNQPTGTPDPNAALGVDLANPEQTLLAFDARVVAGIQERLPLESNAIPVANNRHIVAIRVPNSTSKPHRVHYQGRVYFPSRRERHRYEMDVREIKEMVMRTASRLEEAEGKLSRSFAGLHNANESCNVLVGCIPVFWHDFMVDIRKPEVIQAISRFNLVHGNFVQPTYNFNGLQRKIVANEDSFVQLHRDGMIVLNKRLATVHQGGRVYIRPTAIDIIVRAFVGQCSEVYTTVPITGPFLLTMLFRTVDEKGSLYPMAGVRGAEEAGGIIAPGSYPFPVLQADNLLDVDRVIRPLCDQTHQMFGRDSSPYFDDDGVWSR